jgi:subtilisin family serine protease
MRCFYLFVAAFFALNVCAQERLKIDLRTFNKLKAGQIEDKTLGLLVEGDAAKIEELAKLFGGTFKYNYGTISSVEIPTESVLKFVANKEIEHVENMSAIGVQLMDTSRINANIDSAHNGYAPLLQAYSGKGVIVGIIDGGIYFQQPDFKNPDGTTRIRYIWDQPAASPTAKPQPYNYGQEWSWIDINANKCTHIPPYLSSEFGHGTCVAGIAAGNGRSLTYDTLRYRGVAYESEIIAVRVPLGGTSSSFLARIADAVDYIFKKADALGKPCVINTSVGTYWGSHDGRDLTSRIIDSLLEQKKGRSLVAAAGNAGNVKFHARHEVNGDSAVTYFKYNAANAATYFEFWADTADLNNAEFVIGAVSAKTGSLVDTAQTEKLNVLRNFNIGVDRLTRNLYVDNGNQLLGTIEAFVTPEKGGVYYVEVYITPVDVNPLLYWKFQTFGTAKLDFWATANSSILGTSDMLDVLPNLIIKSDYRFPDSLSTMVSSWQNSNSVISVANYDNRSGYFDIDSVYRDMKLLDGDVPGKQHKSSSFGPTRDNRLKPDISAPGSTTITTGDLRLINGTTGYPGYVGNANRFKVALGGKHIRNGGTSMASPVVAGIAALYLEKRPTARWDEIKTAIVNTAKRDSFTTASANYAYGNGKVNGFRALLEEFAYGCMDSGSINYHPSATLDTGGCVKKVYGCTDVDAINFSSGANVNNGTCIYETSIEKTIAAKKIGVRTYPNPFANETFFAIDGLQQNFNNAEIVINDMIGRTEDKINVAKGNFQYRLANQTLPSGVHLYKLIVDGKTVYTGKVVKY